MERPALEPFSTHKPPSKSFYVRLSKTVRIPHKICMGRQSNSNLQQPGSRSLRRAIRAKCGAMHEHALESLKKIHEVWKNAHIACLEYALALYRLCKLCEPQWAIRCNDLTLKCFTFTAWNHSALIYACRYSPDARLLVTIALWGTNRNSCF